MMFVTANKVRERVLQEMEWARGLDGTSADRDPRDSFVRSELSERKTGLLDFLLGRSLNSISRSVTLQQGQHGEKLDTLTMQYKEREKIIGCTSQNKYVNVSYWETEDAKHYYMQEINGKYGSKSRSRFSTYEVTEARGTGKMTIEKHRKTYRI